MVARSEVQGQIDTCLRQVDGYIQGGASAINKFKQEHAQSQTINFEELIVIFQSFGEMGLGLKNAFEPLLKLIDDTNGVATAAVKQQGSNVKRDISESKAVTNLKTMGSDESKRYFREFCSSFTDDMSCVMVYCDAHRSLIRMVDDFG